MAPRRPLWHCGNSWNQKAFVTLLLDCTKETTEIQQIQGHHGDTVETDGTMGTVTQQGLVEPRSEL